MYKLLGGSKTLYNNGQPPQVFCLIVYLFSVCGHGQAGLD